MKLLATVDHRILSYWNTAPGERVWAYLATFVPLTALACSVISEFVGG